ncbi:MAG: VOC family protein [Candidatus Methylomirabilia bacterium]
MITSYLHAGITVRDLRRSRRFYSDLLGLREIPRPDLGFPGAWYAVGACQLHLMVPPEDRPAGEPPGRFARRVRHLALAVSGAVTLRAEHRTAGTPTAGAPAAHEATGGKRLARRPGPGVV